MMVKSIGYMQVIGLQKLLMFGVIPLVSEEFTSKNRDGAFSSQNFRSPLALKLLVLLKKSGVCKMLRTSSGGDPPLHGGVRNRSWELLFFCLSRSGF